MVDVKTKLMKFILQKVREKTSPDRPYFFIKGSGLKELVEAHGLDLLKLVDEMAKLKMLRKGLVRGRLVLYVHQPVNRKRLQKLEEEFESFCKNFDE